MYNGNLVLTNRVFRFLNNTAMAASGVVYSISPAKLGALISIGLSATTVGQLFEQVRLRRIQIWGQSSLVSGLPAEVSLNVSGVAAGNIGPDTFIQDVAVGQTAVPYIDFRLDPRSEAGQWQNCTVAAAPGTNTFFTIGAPTGSVIDITLDACVTSDSRATGFVFAVTGPATVGQIYYMSLDNAAGATGSVSNNLDPAAAMSTVT